MLRLLAIGVGLSLLSFAIVWIISLRVHNYGFLDVTWALSIAVLASLYAILGNGNQVRKLAFVAVGMAWSLRLGIYILIRVLRHHPEEDKRYRTLRERWPGPARFLLFFELQGIVAVVFSLPFLLAALNPRPALGAAEIVGLLIALCASVGEALADWQAQRFKRDPSNRGAIVNVGLWRYSRHPNYFFESIVWWGFFVAALDSPYGWVTLICPLAMLYFLLFVTGISLSEKHSLESRGEAYREYQRTTSRFVPWFPKTGSKEAWH